MFLVFMIWNCPGSLVGFMNSLRVLSVLCVEIVVSSQALMEADSSQGPQH